MSKSNWLYFFSKALNMKYAYNKQTGEVYTEDKILYTPDEINILKGKEITPDLHNLKKAFNGKIINKTKE